MTNQTRSASGVWAIVVADDHGLDSSAALCGGNRLTPLQYCTLGANRTLFQEALQRAGRIAPAAQILVTTQDAYRAYWEPALWFIRPEHRFVSSNPGTSWLTTAAAILSIAYRAPDSIVNLLPGGCFVSHESILGEAIERAIALLPLIPEAVVTLGMLDADGGIDEDYLVPRKGEPNFLQPLLGIARRPVPWIAQYLRSQGALVASRITCSYARTLAAHIALVWPGLASKLLEPIVARAENSGDRDMAMTWRIPDRLPKALLRSRQWYPPVLPQRALRVRACGWSGLRSPRAVARLSPLLVPQIQESDTAQCSVA